MTDPKSTKYTVDECGDDASAWWVYDSDMEPIAKFYGGDSSDAKKRAEQYVKFLGDLEAIRRHGKLRG